MMRRFFASHPVLGTTAVLALLVSVLVPSVGFGSDVAATVEPEAAKSHPLDPALKIAREGLEHIRRDVQDYTAVIVKRERVSGGRSKISSR